MIHGAGENPNRREAGPKLLPEQETQKLNNKFTKDDWLAKLLMIWQRAKKTKRLNCESR